MKKLNVLCACLVFAATATTMTSCVKDSESPSVEIVRSAKAEQLKALASMQKAAGEADLIRANAEAALMTAQAKYQEALAAAENASTARQEMENQRAKATLELEIQAAILQAEADLLTAERDFATAKAGYDKWVAQQPANPYLDGLWLRFNELTGQAQTANRDLVDAKSTLLSLEAGLVSAKDWVATQLRTINVNLQAAKELKAVYEALPDNGRDAMQAALSTNKAEREGLVNGVQPILDPINKSAKAVIDEYKNTIYAYGYPAKREDDATKATPRVVETNSAFMAARYGNFNLSYTYFDEIRQADIEVADFRDGSGMVVRLASFQEHSTLIAPDFIDYLKTKQNSAKVGYDYHWNKNNNNNRVDSMWQTLFLTDYVVTYDALDNKIAELTGVLETKKADLAKQLAVTPVLATLKATAATAKAEYEKEAAKEQTPAQAVITANKLDAYHIAANDARNREMSDNNAKTNVNIAAAQLGAMKQLKADVETVSEYKAAVASIQTKVDALAAEKAPYYAWLTKYDVNKKVFTELSTALDRNPDLKALIQAQETAIADLEIQIKQLETYRGEDGNGTLTNEYAISLQKQILAAYEAKKAKLDADLAALKAKIDAEIAK